MLKAFVELFDAPLKGAIEVAVGDGGFGAEGCSPDLVDGACAALRAEVGPLYTGFESVRYGAAAA